MSVIFNITFSDVLLKILNTRPTADTKVYILKERRKRLTPACQTVKINCNFLMIINCDFTNIRFD